MAIRSGAPWAALALVCTLASSAVAAESIVDLVQAAKPAVVTVITYDADGSERGRASGFFVKSDEIITNWHVIKTAKSVRTKTIDGTTYAVTKILARDERADLALLKLDKANTTVMPLRMTVACPKEGERVVVIGCAGGLSTTVSDGIVSALREIPEVGRVIQITAPVSHGSSGSPVVNARGEVVGVVIGYYKDGQNLNFAVPSERVLALRPGTAGSHASVPSGAGAGADVSTRIRSAVVMMRKGEYSSALRDLQNIAEANPKSHLAWGLVGTCHLLLRQYKEAVPGFQEAIRIKGDSPEWYNGLALALVGIDEPHKAIKAYKAAIAIEPDNAFAHYGLGLLHVTLKDKKSALEEYNVLLKLDQEKAVELLAAIHGK